MERSERACRGERGFSLAELAVVLVIVAILSAGALAALRAQTERSRFAEARAMIDETREALLNYAAVTGALPCPDTSAGGLEGEPDACAMASLNQGYVPWKTLGIARADPWGQTLRYAVSAKFTSTATLSLGAESNVPIVRQAADGSTESLANEKSVAMALWSSGPDAQSKTPMGGTTVFAEAPDSDDIVSWLSRFVLVGRMLEAGRDVPQN